MIHEIDVLQWAMDAELLLDDISAVQHAKLGLSNVNLSFSSSIGAASTIQCVPAFSAPWPWLHTTEVIWPDTVIKLDHGNPLDANDNGQAWIYSADQSCFVPIATEIPPLDPFSTAMSEFIDQLKSGAVSQATASEALKTLKVIEAAERRLAAK